MKLIIFLIASLFIFTGLIGFINSPNNLNININHNPYPVNVNNSVSYVREFPINLNNIPSGTGYYQQLITIGNASYPYSNYNINSQGSNIQFISQNNSYLYAWVQNINTTTISVWVKNFNSSNLINMQVFPEFENLFSSTGYLGEAPQLSSSYTEYDNGKNVFPYYWNFAGTTLPSSFTTAGTGSYIQNNGITISSSDNYEIITTIPSGNTTIDSLMELNSSTNGNIAVGYGGGNSLYPLYNGYTMNFATGYNNMYEYSSGSSSEIAAGSYSRTTAVYSLALSTAPSQTAYQNYTSKGSATNSSLTLSSFNELAIGAATGGSIQLTWLNVRTYLPSMPTFNIGTGYYFLNITSIYTNTNTSISNNYFWNGHITDIECYVLPELNNQPIIPLNYSGYITNSGLIYLNSSQFVNYHYNITFKYYSTVSPINYTFNQFYMPIFELGMIFLIGSVVYIEIRGYYKSMKER